MFSILLTTYNRHEWFRQTLQSILLQTYTDFEVFVCDRGSVPSVEYIVREFNDPRVKLWGSSQDINANDSANEILTHMRGDYFAFIADDDAWVPTALERVNKEFDLHPDCGIVQTGLTVYMLDQQQQRIDSFFRSILVYSPFSTQEQDDVHVYDGETFCRFFFSQFYLLSPKTQYPTCFHSSGIFIRFQNIKETLIKQKELFIKQFGDIGYFGVAWNTRIVYINLPLTIIGKVSSYKQEQETSFIDAPTFRWASASIEQSPLKRPSFKNLSLDACLKVIRLNNISKTFKIKISPSLFFDHTDQYKKYKNTEFWKNYKNELLISKRSYIFNHPIIYFLFSIKRFFLSYLYKIKLELEEKDQRKYNKKYEIFNNINEFSDFIEKYMIKKRMYMQNDKINISFFKLYGSLFLYFLKNFMRNIFSVRNFNVSYKEKQKYLVVFFIKIPLKKKGT